VERIINLTVVNKMTLPKNTNLVTINGRSLIACNGCEDIEVGGGVATGSDVLIDGGTFLTPTNSVLIDAGTF